VERNGATRENLNFCGVVFRSLPEPMVVLFRSGGAKRNGQRRKSHDRRFPFLSRVASGGAGFRHRSLLPAVPLSRPCPRSTRVRTCGMSRAAAPLNTCARRPELARAGHGAAMRGNDTARRTPPRFTATARPATLRTAVRCAEPVNGRAVHGAAADYGAGRGIRGRRTLAREYCGRPARGLGGAGWGR